MQFTSSDSKTFVRATPDDELDLSVLTPGTLVGRRYRIVSLLGRGGMGEVYRADDLRLRQPVALKFLTLPADGDAFLDELRIGRRLAHPNICRIYDLGGLSGRLYLTMEFIDGEDLESLLRRIGRLPPEKALSVARDICAGLAAAHKVGIIHRDLKPSNIMIDGRGRARITDFGLAIAHDMAVLYPQAGTLAYMAPEQILGTRATVKSDLYAFGLILYEISTGREVERTNRNGFALPSDLVPGIDPVVERMILRCLELDPAARPSSAQVVLDAFPLYDPLAEAVAAGETPSPGVVAAAAVKGDLPTRTAQLLLLLGAIAVAGAMFLGSQSIPPLQAPQILAERARSIVSVAGVDLTDADTTAAYIRGESEILDPIPRRIHVRSRSVVTYVHRTSPHPLQPYRRVVTAHDPPLDIPGMTFVRLDSEGKLLDLFVVPPRLRQRSRNSPDWQRMLAFTSVDRSLLAGAKPKWSAPADADEHRAWIVKGSQRRIEAASRDGRIIWLSLIEPWQALEQRTTERLDVIGTRITIAVFTLLAFSTALLALRNVRRGQGDRSGAWRITAAYVIAYVAAWMIAANHASSGATEWNTFRATIGFALFGGAIVWIMYLAVEPYARRRWPGMLISWTRLLSGRWRDPIVGRDVLFGCVAGALTMFMARAPAIAPKSFGIDGALPLLTDALPLGSPRYALFWLLFPICLALLRSIAVVAEVLLLRAMIGKAAAPVAIVITAAMIIDSFAGQAPVRIVSALIGATLVIALLFRYGVLAVMVMSYVIDVVLHLPFSLRPSAWYFDQSLFAAALLATLFAGSFYVAVASKIFRSARSAGGRSGRRSTTPSPRTSF